MTSYNESEKGVALVGEKLLNVSYDGEKLIVSCMSMNGLLPL